MSKRRPELAPLLQVPSLLQLLLPEVAAHYLLSIAGHWSEVTALSVPRLTHAIKKPAIADGVACMRFCQEMYSDNTNAPCFSPKDLLLLSACE